MTLVLDGRPIAKDIRAAVSDDCRAYRAEGIVPTLAIVIATNDESAWWYVRSIETAATACELAVTIIELAAEATTEQIAEKLQAVAIDDTVHGIMLQTPLPKGVVADELTSLIPPAKDVDGVNPLSAGRILYGMPAFAPATAESVMVILNYYKIELQGKHAVIIGRSRVVGKPVASLMLQQDATVTICHSKTANIASISGAADVLVVAVGQPGFVQPAMVGSDTVVIDVGTTVDAANKLVGDVDPAVADSAAGLSPVPGGVGPVTTALILQHTVAAAGRTAAAL